MWRVVILVCIAAARAELAEEEDGQRQDRVLSVFNVVTFPNSACGASNGYNGTCYTSSGTGFLLLRFKCDVFGVLKDHNGIWEKGFLNCMPGLKLM